jgi:hypothetical protein
MPSLPDQSFNEIAVDLKLYANSAATAFAAGEVMAARGGWADGFKHSLAELQASAIMSGRLYEFFRAYAAHEEIIRDFLSGLEQEAVPTPAPRVASGGRHGR